MTRGEKVNTAKKRLKCLQMVEMLRQLQPLLSHKDVWGYVAARNTRILNNQLIEYNKVHDELMERFGTPQENENGVKMLGIKVGTPEFQQFCDALEPFANIEHEVEIMTMKYEETIDRLSGEEILAIEWMLED